MKNKGVFIAALVALALVAIFSAVLSVTPSAAAPLPAPTPVSVARTGVAPLDVTFFTAESVTADTTSTCIALANYERADIYYNVTIDGSNVNTTALTMQFGNSPSALVDGIALQASTGVSVTNMQQVQLFGRYTCIKIDATDAATGTVIVTANALAK